MGSALILRSQLRPGSTRSGSGDWNKNTVFPVHISIRLFIKVDAVTLDGLELASARVNGLEANGRAVEKGGDHVRLGKVPRLLAITRPAHALWRHVLLKHGDKGVPDHRKVEADDPPGLGDMAKLVREGVVAEKVADDRENARIRLAEPPTSNEPPLLAIIAYKLSLLLVKV